MKHSIKEPIPEIFEAWDDLNAAVDAHLAGDFAEAALRFRWADSRALWNWINPGWMLPRMHIVDKAPLRDTVPIPAARRDPDAPARDR